MFRTICSKFYVDSDQKKIFMFLVCESYFSKIAQKTEINLVICNYTAGYYLCQQKPPSPFTKKSSRIMTSYRYFFPAPNLTKKSEQMYFSSLSKIKKFICHCLFFSLLRLIPSFKCEVFGIRHEVVVASFTINCISYSEIFV